MPPLPARLDAAVERHWTAACAEAPLFNGRIFSADAITADEITGHWSEYRRTVAQMRDPALVAAIGVRNLAVCGVLCGPDGVAIGRRNPAAAYQAGLWQMPPAGSVDHGAAEPGARQFGAGRCSTSCRRSSASGRRRSPSSVRCASYTTPAACWTWASGWTRHCSRPRSSPTTRPAATANTTRCWWPDPSTSRRSLRPAAARPSPPWPRFLAASFPGRTAVGG